MMRECDEWEAEAGRKEESSVERAVRVWRARKHEEKRLERRYQAHRESGHTHTQNKQHPNMPLFL